MLDNRCLSAPLACAAGGEGWAGLGGGRLGPGLPGAGGVQRGAAGAHGRLAQHGWVLQGLETTWRRNSNHLLVRGWRPLALFTASPSHFFAALTTR